MNSSIKPKGRILVIDDSEELLEVIQLILERQGYEVIAKNNPVGVSDLVQNTHIDVLLLDVLLLGKNGRDICAALKSDDRTNYFPIILMSATPQLLANHTECIADDFIEKPFDINFLLVKIEKVMATVS